MKLHVNGSLTRHRPPRPGDPAALHPPQRPRPHRLAHDSAAASASAAPAPCTSTARPGAPASPCCPSLNEADQITTLEGLGTAEQPHPLQQAFIDEAAVQCGYCINGMIMQAADFLSHNKHPSEAEVKTALENNLCRCGTHLRIVRAVQRAAGVA